MYPPRQVAHDVLRKAGLETTNSHYVVRGWGLPVTKELLAYIRMLFAKYPTCVYNSYGTIAVYIRD